MAVAKRGRRQSTKRQKQNAEGRSWVTPGMLIAVTACVLLAYIVVKRGNEISNVSAAGIGIAFRSSSAPQALSPEEKKQRSQQIEAKVEESVREAAPAESGATAVEMTGTWRLVDGTATWTVTIENGYLIFREQNTAAPGVISAVGYGNFDGRTWALRVQTIVGTTGTATLEVQADGTLQGEAEIAGEQFSLSLQR